MSFRLIPLIILGVLSCINFGIILAKHGEERTNYNAWIGLLDLILTWGLLLWMIL